VLIVEDDADARDMLRYALEAGGQDVAEAADGNAAIQVAHDFRPDVALIDIGLPGMDGFEVARRLRAAPGDTRIRLIALTGYGLPSDRQRARDAGFDEHLVKPVDPARLLDIIESA
jgi:CheY-like chemotaxis protein